MCRMCHDPRFQTQAEKRSDVDFTEQRVDGETWFCDEPFGVTAKRAPGKKDKARWCKGKVGREHSPIVDIPPNVPSYRRPCGWRNGWDWRIRKNFQYWSCCHVKRCAECSKVIRGIVGSECPDYSPQAS